MDPLTRTPEGQPNRCPVCGKRLVIEPSQPMSDAPCPHCGCLLWFNDTVGWKETYGFHQIVVSDPSIRTKAQALGAILDRLVTAGTLEEEHRPGVLAALLKREALGSTGLGRGVAIPHAAYPGVASALGVLARFSAGIDFGSLDGQPVRLVCLVVSPADRPGEHLRVLEALARRLREAG